MQTDAEPIRKQIAALERMTVGQLRERYAEVFGEATRSHHKDYLVRRIAWRVLANAEGDITTLTLSSRCAVRSGE